MPGETAAELFERADYALYHGKLTEKGQLVIFSDAHERLGAPERASSSRPCGGRISSARDDRGLPADRGHYNEPTA